MFVNRFVNIFLVVLLWLSASGFQTFPQRSSSTLPRAAGSAQVVILAAPAPFSKVAPVNNATGVNTTGAVLSWTASSDNVTYQYCLRANASKRCPAKKWISVGASTTATLQGLSSNTQYYWQVRAVSNVDGSITQATGIWWTFRTRVNTALPGAFTKSAPADESLGVPINGLVISWAASLNATGYLFCYDTVNDNVCNTSWVSTSTTRTATLNDLSFNQLYFWQVRATNASGFVEADTGTWFNFTTSLGPPPTFSKRAPADAAPEQPLNLTLTWYPTTGQVTAYEYCYDSNGGSTCQNQLVWASAGMATTASVSGLNYDTAYSWQVRARNASGTTQANSGTYWNFSTAIAPPASFNKISLGADLQPVNPTIAWTTSAGNLVTYEYCYTDTPSATTCDKVWYQAGNTTQAALSGLKYDTQYYWQVRAANSTGTTYADNGELQSFHTRLAPPFAFSKLSPKDGATDQPVDITLSWSPSENASKYYFCYDTTNDNLCANWLLNDGETSVTLTGLEYGEKTYYWQVYAESTEGEIEANNNTWWSFTTIQAYPGDFTKFNPQDGVSDVQLTPWLYWTDSTDAESYSYCVSTTPSCPVGEWVLVGLNKSVQVPVSKNLQHETLYYWQVRADNSSDPDGTEADAKWYSFTTLKTGPTSTDQNFPSGVEDTTLIGQLLAQSNYAKIFSQVGSPPPGDLVLASDGQFSYTPPQNFEGQVTFQFIVSDGYNLPSPVYDATILIVGENDPPVLASLSNIKIKTGQPVTFTVTAADVDIPYGDHLKLSIVEPLPLGATFNQDTGLFHWVARWSPTHPKPYIFTVRVEDDALAFDTQEVQITVVPEKVIMPLIKR